MRIAKMLLASFLLTSVFTLQGANVSEIKARKKLIMLCHPDPLGFVNEISPGKFEGFDVEIMKTLANSLGVALEVKPLDNFKDLIPALLANQGDVVASSVTITEERKKIVGFSDSYFPVVMIIVVKKDSKISNKKDLSGKRCSVTLGTIMEEQMKAIPGVKLIDAADSAAQYKALSKGEADFAPFDSSSVIGSIDKYPNLKIAFHFPERYDYGFVVPPDSDLKDAINAHLKKMQDSGAWYTMVRRSLGDRGLKMLEMIKKDQK
jgi:ABC-type amino acid transport substrate-binding protein